MVSRTRQSVGVFTTDRALVVQSWDPWMAAATGISESAACGQPLAQLYPDLASRGLLARLRRVADGLGVDVLAPALHKYLLPCPPRDRTSRFERMRQHVTLAPLRNHDGVAGVVVTIEDVTERFDRDRRLAADLDSHDEAVRLRAVKSLAAAGDAPSLLANALTDASWRVRRVAAEGMADSGGREVVDTLVEALREHHRDAALLNSALTALARTREDVVMSIVALLDLDDADVRTYAALALGLIDDVRAVPPLIARLDDPDMNVRFHAIEALGRLGCRGAADAIATVAESRDFFLSFAALDALAAIGEPSVAPRLIPLLTDESLRPAAAACLGTLGAEDVAIPLAALIENSPASSAPIAVALANVFDRMEEEFHEGALIADLATTALTLAAARGLIDAAATASDEELRGIAIVLSWMAFDGIDAALAGLLRRPGVRNVVADRLARRGVAAAPFIEQILPDSDEETKRAAAFALGRLGSRTSVPTLVPLLSSDEPPGVIIAVASALGSIGDPLAFHPLLAMMDHPESVVRQAAVSALSSIGHPQMEAVMAGRLIDESPRVRESAARVAGYFGYGSCLRKMVELCDDADPIVRRSAVESLANYDQRPAWSKIYETVSSDSDATVRGAAARALGRSATEDSLTALVLAARDPNVWVRYYAVRSLANRRSTHADVLATLAERATLDNAAPVRIAALEALGALGGETMIPVVIPLTRDQETEVACAAIATLGYCSPEMTSAVLLDALSNDDPRRQRAALDALGLHGAQAGEASVRAVRDIARQTRDDEVRRHAIRTLGFMGTEAAIEALVALGGDGRLRRPVVAALAGLNAGQTAPLRRVLADGDDAARGLVVDALARMKHPPAGPILMSALADRAPAVRLAAARAIGRLDLHDARDRLAALATSDHSPAVRLAAENALRD